MPVEEYGVPGVLENWWEEGVSFDFDERRFNDYKAENFLNVSELEKFG